MVKISFSWYYIATWLLYQYQCNLTTCYNVARWRVLHSCENLPN